MPSYHHAYRPSRTDSPLHRGRLILGSLAVAVIAVLPIGSAEATFVPGARSLFQTPVLRQTSVRPFWKWTGVLSRSQAQAQRPTAEWQGFLSGLSGRDRRSQIEAVNAHVNRVRYVSDAANYRMSDYWATPAELFARGGDCEDYVVAKYMALKSLGFPTDKMHLVTVFDRVTKLYHAVLVVSHGGRALVLDNQVKAVVSASQSTRYKPIYSINEQLAQVYRP